MPIVYTLHLEMDKDETKEYILSDYQRVHDFVNFVLENDSYTAYRFLVNQEQDLKKYYRAAKEI